MTNDTINADGVKEISINDNPAISIDENSVMMDLNRLAELLINFENRIKALEAK